MSRWSEAWASSRHLLIASTETPGPGTAAPSRYTAMIARENSSLRRRSGVRNAAANACSTCPPRVGRVRLATREGVPVQHPWERAPIGRLPLGRPGSAGARAGQQKAPLQGLAASSRVAGCRGVLFQIRVVLPPAAPIFSAADAEKACAWTSTLTPPSSPVPRTLTGWPRRTAPASASVSGLTGPPRGNGAAIRSRLTTWKTTLFGLLKPESLGSRMCSGVCPPSNRAWVLPRAPVPLVPRPAVLPLEPSPRPTRVFAVWAPRAGRRWWTLRVMRCPYSASADLFNGDQVRHRRDHPADLGTVLLHDRVVDPLQPERAQRLPLVALGADRRLDLGDLELCHLRLPDPHARGAWRPGRRPRGAGRGEPRSPRGGRGPSAPASWRARC